MGSEFNYAKYGNQEIRMQELQNGILRIFIPHTTYNSKDPNPGLILLKFIRENREIIKDLDGDNLIIFNDDGSFEIENDYEPSSKQWFIKGSIRI
jgi:hypothetical protein